MTKSYTKEEIVCLAEKVHGSYYNYDLLDYKNMNTKGIIVCPVHGSF